MKRLISKAVVGTLVLLGISMLFFGRETLSYVRTAVQVGRDNVDDLLGLEFQLKRAKSISGDLTRDLDGLIRVFAEQQIAAEQLEKKVAAAQARGSEKRLRSLVVGLRQKLNNEGQFVDWQEEHLTRPEAERRLSDVFLRYTATKQLATLRENTLQAKREALRRMRQKIIEMRANKERLALECQRVEAMLQCLRAQEVSPDMNFAQTTRTVEKVLDQIETRAKILVRTAEHRRAFLAERTPTAETGDEQHQDIVTAVDAYLACEETSR